MKRLLFLALVIALVAGCGGSTHSSLHAHGFGAPPKGDFGLAHHFGATSLILGQDNVDLSRIPTTVAAVGCYASGPFTNCTAAAQRFPHAHLVSIAVSASANVGRILDTEPGDATPSEDPGWIQRAFARHVWHPGIYSDAAEMGSVRADLNAAGLHQCSSSSTTANCYVLWLADWDHNPAIPAGFQAKQYSGGNVQDFDSFLPSFFTQPKQPNAPGCSTPSIKTSYCWGRFTTLDWFNRPAGSKSAKVKPWCYYGCVERSLVKRLTGEIFAAQTPAGLKGDLGRAKAICGRLIYLEQHRSVKENGDTYTYGRKLNVCGRSKNIARKSWKGYL